MGLAVTENKSSNRVTVKERVKLFVVMVICYLASWRSLFTFDIDLKITKIPKTVPLFYHLFMDDSAVAY